MINNQNRRNCYWFYLQFSKRSNKSQLIKGTYKKKNQKQRNILKKLRTRTLPGAPVGVIDTAKQQKSQEIRTLKGK